MSDDARDRLVMLSRRWDVAVGTTWETETSVLAFGSRRGRPVVLIDSRWNSATPLAISQRPPSRPSSRWPASSAWRA